MKTRITNKPMVQACWLAGWLLAPMTWAETHTMMSGMECQESDAHCAHHQGTDHSQMNHGEMNHGEMNHGEMNHGEMNHGEMNMQGGTAPADARDPHAYSGGYTLTSGPYARSGDRQLRLADEHHFSALIIDQFEWAQHDGSTSSRLGGEYWYGTTWDRAVVQLDGEHQQGDTEAELGLYWRHAVTAFWNTQLGVRYDTTPERSRYWVGAGFQGLAPYWLESQAMVFVGEQGITRLELETEYDLLLTQRWILGLEGKLTAAGKRDPQDTFAQGLNDTQFSGRFRYEFSRQFAPYVGVERRHVYGATADILGESAATKWLLGVKAWF